MSATLETRRSARPHAEPPLAGLWQLYRHIVRRDRVRMIVWAASMTLFAVYFTFALTTVFDEAALAARAAVMSTPSGIVMGGPGYGLDDYTPPVAMANEGVTWLILALAIMSILHVIRHTRAGEENGTAELVRASAVSRHTTAVATLLTLTVHLLIIAALGAAGMVLVGTEVPVVDAVAMMLGCALVALVFGAVALVTAQVTAHARGATGAALVVFAIAYAVRAAGDLQETGGSPLSWFSPIAWAQQTRSFVDLRWWPLLLPLAATVLLLVLAAQLARRRDFGAGLVAGRPGPADAGTLLRSPFALAWLQQRGALLWTGLAMGLMWFGAGTMMSTLNEMVADLVDDNPVLAALFGSEPSAFTTSFLGAMVLFISISVGAYAVVMGQHPKAEEASGRLELTLSTPVGRSRWLAAQLIVAGLGTLLLLAVSIFGMWAGAALVGIEDPTVGDFAVVWASYAPGVLALLALTAALYGWVPRATSAGWAALAFFFVIDFFGPLFDLPEWVQGLSPFHWVPTAFGDDVDMSGVLGVSAVCATLFALAFWGFRRRDLVTG
ncbi:ABC transporter permease [Microbacterium sp. NPDC056234]|uniref:ABC transporter permease n=1 Tax=Microbacterium sp. NPDC056234 TaxID=3345757 RepID=UPI0035DC2863